MGNHYEKLKHSRSYHQHYRERKREPTQIGVQFITVRVMKAEHSTIPLVPKYSRDKANNLKNGWILALVSCLHAEVMAQ